jgi:hypothetical protein
MNTNYLVTVTISVDGSFDEVFPLFSPEGERNWAHGWCPEFIYHGTETASVGTVFSTGDGDGQTVWRLDVYDPLAGHVRLIRHALGRHLGIVEIHVRSVGEYQTEATVTYDITSLTEIGAQSLREFGEVGMALMLEEWEVKINHYLKMGEPLAPTPGERHQEWMDRF